MLTLRLRKTCVVNPHKRASLLLLCRHAGGVYSPCHATALYFFRSKVNVCGVSFPSLLKYQSWLTWS